MLDGEKLPIIEARRVRLRHLEESDTDSLFEIFSDREAMRFWSTPPFTSRAEAANLLAEIHEFFRQKSLFQWGIALRENDGIIGTATLFRFDRQSRRAEIGYILNRRFWGNGFINEALAALLEFAFEKLSLNRIEADIDPRNAASARVVERLGFRREGLLRERWIVGGERQDTLFYGLLESDWNKLKE
ncbi:MAG TPA: GNAT family N-acetyltransferase [Pyrinomonadaceae bacterium]|jgi:RimJ/RimL family protein N-acetyltransferase